MWMICWIFSNQRIQPLQQLQLLASQLRFALGWQQQSLPWYHQGCHQRVDLRRAEKGHRLKEYEKEWSESKKKKKYIWGKQSEWEEKCLFVSSECWLFALLFRKEKEDNLVSINLSYSSTDSCLSRYIKSISLWVDVSSRCFYYSLTNETSFGIDGIWNLFEDIQMEMLW